MEVMPVSGVQALTSEMFAGVIIRMSVLDTNADATSLASVSVDEG
jgi:hypothetical protein